MIRNILSSAGYTLQRKTVGSISKSHDENSMAAGLERMKKIGISPKNIIDVGAAQGSWTKKAMEIWPSAEYHLIEPLRENEYALKQLQLKNPKVQYHLSVAGEDIGTVNLHVSEDLDGSGIYGDDGDKTRSVPMMPIDNLMSNDESLIKLDTHGYEIPILKGAKVTLQKTSLLVIEVYGFFVSPTSLLFNQLTNYLDEIGFRLIDMVDIMRRPGDNAFWQCDAFYIRKDHPVFRRTTYA
jgi:FkbM family methyltransferase